MKAVIFDLGNVLINFDHRIAAKKIARFSGKSPEEIFSLFFDSEITGMFEEGKISPLEFFSEVKKLLGADISYQEFLPIWNEIFFLNDENRKVHGLARSLKKNYKVALLSNVNILHFEFVKNKFVSLEAFHSVIASYEVGLRKPHPEIYKKALKSLGVSAEETFYTDDRIELIESAKALGIRGFVYKNSAQLEVDLLSVGIKTK